MLCVPCALACAPALVCTIGRVGARANGQPARLAGWTGARARMYTLHFNLESDVSTC